MYRAYEHPNGGWYVAWENAEGFHHQPDGGGEQVASAMRSLVVGDTYINDMNLTRKERNYVYSRSRSVRIGPCLLRLRLTRQMRRLVLCKGSAL